MARIVILGGSGKIAKVASSKLARNHTVISVIRNADQAEAIKALGAQPKVLSIEEGSKEEFSSLFEGSDVVIWSAGAGGKGGPERTKAVDEIGAIKIMDAIDALERKPRFITVSAIDARNKSKRPDHYTNDDLEASEKAWAAIPAYYKAKVEADSSLIKRSFPWLILRPGRLLDDAATGKIDIGILGLTPSTAVTREDVADVLVELVSRKDAHGLALDLRNGKTALKQAVNDAIERRTSSINL